MPSLIHRIFGFPESSSGRRPQQWEFTGINWNVPTALNMLVCLPMWEPDGCPALDLGPLGLIGKPKNILRTQDTYFGDVYQGDNVLGSPTATARGYDFGYVKELNFGLGPSPFSMSFWFNIPTDWAPSTDCYLATFDDTGAANFPGWAVSFDLGDAHGSVRVFAINTGNTTFGDAGHKTQGPLNDGTWHHMAFSHQPGTAGAADSINRYFLDGKKLTGLWWDGATDATVGPVSTTSHFFIGTDDDGISQPFYGQFCDLRLYRDALSDDRAAAMYHPDTRWEIYFPAKRAFFLPLSGTAYSRLLSDNLGGQEGGFSRLASSFRLPADNLGGQDTFARLAPAARVSSDNLGLSDSVLRKAPSLRATADNLGLSDTAARLAASLRLSADSLGASDSAARVAAALRALADNLGASDAFARVAPALRPTSDSLGATDTFARVAPAFRVLLDNLGLSDAAARQSAAFRTAPDNLGLSDAAARAAALLRALADSGGLSDSAARVAPALRQSADSAGGQDAFARLAPAFRQPADSLGGQDAFSRTAPSFRASADSLGLSDAALRLAASLRKLTDNLGVTDSATLVDIAAGVHLLLVLDTLGASDAASRRADSFRRVIDSLALADLVALASTAHLVVSWWAWERAYDLAGGF